MRTAIMLLTLSVTAYAATQMVVGHRYDLTGTMSREAETGDLLMTLPARAAAAPVVRIVPSLGTNLNAVYGTMKPGQTATASGIFLGAIPGAGSDTATLPTLRADKMNANPLQPGVREEKFRSLYDLRRQ